MVRNIQVTRVSLGSNPGYRGYEIDLANESGTVLLHLGLEHTPRTAADKARQFQKRYEAKKIVWRSGKSRR